MFNSINGVTRNYCLKTAIGCSSIDFSKGSGRNDLNVFRIECLACSALTGVVEDVVETENDNICNILNPIQDCAELND